MLKSKGAEATKLWRTSPPTSLSPLAPVVSSAGVPPSLQPQSAMGFGVVEVPMCYDVAAEGMAPAAHEDNAIVV